MKGETMKKYIFFIVLCAYAHQLSAMADEKLLEALDTEETKVKQLEEQVQKLEQQVQELQKSASVAAKPTPEAIIKTSYCVCTYQPAGGSSAQRNAGQRCIAPLNQSTPGSCRAYSTSFNLSNNPSTVIGNCGIEYLPPSAHYGVCSSINKT